KEVPAPTLEYFPEGAVLNLYRSMNTGDYGEPRTPAPRRTPPQLEAIKRANPTASYLWDGPSPDSGGCVIGSVPPERLEVIFDLSADFVLTLYQQDIDYTWHMVS